MNKDIEKALKAIGVEDYSAVNTAVGFKCIPTTFTSFDRNVLQIGGIPLKRVTEIYGPEGSYKSTLLARAAVSAQKEFPDKFVGIADTEGTWTREWMVAQGLDLERCQYLMCNTQEEVFLIVDKWLNSGVFSLVGIDSLANLMPSKMDSATWYSMDKKSGNVVSDYAVGVYAKNNSEFVKKATKALMKHDVALVVTNQIRAVIGGFQRPGMPAPVSTPGGYAVTFATSLRLVMSKVEDIEGKNGEVEGGVVRVTVKRSKLGVGGKRTDDSNHLRFYIEDGLKKNEVFNVLDEAIMKGVLLKSGAWYNFLEEDEIIAKYQGLDKVKAHFMNNEEDFAKLKHLTESSEVKGYFSEEPTLTVVEDD